MPGRVVYSFALTLLLFATAAAQKPDAPKLTPVPSSEKQGQLIKEGVALHDRGDFDGAIAKYDEVLRENPDNIAALYESAFSYSSKKDYRKSLERAYRGAQYKSDLLHRFYVLIGNNLDLSGEPNKALEVYKAGLRVEPDSPLLHYNMAITYLNVSKPDEARKSLKRSAALAPDHASSHLALGSLFYRTNYKTPAFFAVARFLVLEPTSARSAGALKLLQEVLRGGVSQGKSPNEINLSLDMSGKKDEGDFSTIDMFFGLSKAASMTEKGEGKTEAQLMVEQLDSLLSVVSETEAKGDKSKFVFRYYIPYFVELKRRNYVEPFAYYISQRGNLQGAQQWMAANQNRVLEFLTWSRRYEWPKID